MILTKGRGVTHESRGTPQGDKTVRVSGGMTLRGRGMTLTDTNKSGFDTNAGRSA